MSELTLALMSLPPFTLGYAAGLAARGLAWVRAAFVEGYYRGRGHELADGD